MSRLRLLRVQKGWLPWHRIYLRPFLTDWRLLWSYFKAIGSDELLIHLELRRRALDPHFRINQNGEMQYVNGLVMGMRHFEAVMILSKPFLTYPRAHHVHDISFILRMPSRRRREVTHHWLIIWCKDDLGQHKQRHSWCTVVMLTCLWDFNEVCTLWTQTYYLHRS